MYLHKKELKALIGASQRAKISAWLKKNGIPYMIDATGWPVVSESVILSKLGQPTKKEPRINFA